MTIPTKEQLLTLDYTYVGLPLVRVLAKDTVDPDQTYAGLPFLVFGGAGGGDPGDPPPYVPHPPTYMMLALSTPPNTSATLGRETGDPLLTDDGFTMVEEDEALPASPATVELFQTSTPTTGTWALDQDYRTNAPTDGVLRSPLPTQSLADESAYLTVVTTAPNTRISFEWGVHGFDSFDDSYSDTLRFYVDDIPRLTAIPLTTVDGTLKLSLGTCEVVVPPGTHTLRWRWQRAAGVESWAAVSHAWIAALIIDPNF